MNPKNILQDFDYGAILFIAVMLLPFLLFSKIAALVIVATLVVLMGRINPIYDNLKIEIHSVIMLAVGFVHGVWPAVYIAFGSALFANRFGKYFGVAQWPHFVVLDSVYMSVIAYIASMLTLGQLQVYGFIVVAIGTVLLRSTRVIFFMDPMTRAVMLVTISIIFNYIIIQNFLPTLLQLVG